MSTQDTTLPSLIYARLDPGVDPLGIALALDLERQLADGDVALFVDGERPSGGAFDLRRWSGVFRLRDIFGTPVGVYASAAAAVRDGWRNVDAGP